MEQAFDYFVVLDFEATCDTPQPPSPQEIIEFPSVLLAGDSLQILDTFESFVRPQHHGLLSEFCRTLTTITQAQVDAAPLFSEVLDSHLRWLRSHALPTSATESGPSYAFITCGDWDLATMLPAQLRAILPPLGAIPWPYRRWINIKRHFAASPAGKRKPQGMPGMLEALGLPLVGVHHRGIDDCKNIAAIARALAEGGQALSLTGALAPSRYPPLRLVLEDGAGLVHEVQLNKRALKTLLGLASGTLRRRIRELRPPEGVPLLADEDLCDLVDGDRLLAR